MSAYTAHLMTRTTAANAAGNLGRLRAFARRHPTPLAVERETLVAYLSRPDWSPATRKNHRATLGCAFSWWHAHQLIPHNPSEDLPRLADLKPDEPAAKVTTAPHETAGEHPARAWARSNDWPLAPSGRLGDDLIAAWVNAGSPSPALSSSTVPERWVELIAAWTKEQRARSLSPATIALRTHHARRLANDTGRDPAAIDRQAILDWLASRELAPASRRAMRSSVRSLFAFAHDSGLLGHNPAARVPAVREAITVPRPAPEPIVRDAVNNARADVRLMVLLGALAGLRAGEIARLHTSDIGEDTFHITGKGGRERLVPIHPVLVAELASYREARQVTEGYLFTPKDRLGRYTRGHVSHLISSVMPPGWSAHRLRARFGTLAYATTYDLRAVQDLLGHSSPAITARYVAVTSTALQAAVNAVPPVPDMQPADYKDARKYGTPQTGQGGVARRGDDQTVGVPA